MKKPKNVIDFNARRAIQFENHGEAEIQENLAAGHVLDMTERRQEVISQERRKVRRTILTEFIAAHVVLPGRGLQRVTLYDISEAGLAFDIDLGVGSYRAGDNVGFRLYINHQTYFPFVVRVANVREIPEEGVARHGSSFVKGTINTEALHHLVKFIETVSTNLKTDSGDVLVSNLRS